MDALKRFSATADALLATNSRIKKAKVLQSIKEDEDAKYFIRFLLNPYVTTGISKKKLLKKIEPVDSGVRSSIEMLELAARVKTGPDLLLAEEFGFMRWLGSQDPSGKLSDLFSKVLSKNLPLGIDAKTVNRELPGLVPTFSVQLAQKYFDDPHAIDGKEFTLTTKLDGNRVIAMKRHGEVQLLSRQGREYEGLSELEDELASAPFDDICLDGELLADRADGEESKDQFLRTQRLARSKGADKRGLRMMCFDVLPAEDFVSQASQIPYSSRRAELESLFSHWRPEHFKLVEALYSGTDVSMIDTLLREKIAASEEGIMINVNSAPYRFDRTKDLLKVKLFKDADLEIVGFKEGSNRYSGTLGALVVDYDGNDVEVGSGLSDELRDEIWAHREDWLGRTAIVQYFEETTNQRGGKSLRFPVYLDWREDK